MEWFALMPPAERVCTPLPSMNCRVDSVYPRVVGGREGFFVRLAVALVFFFFSSRRRHTRFKCDWSSDVCSSDLGARRRKTTATTDRVVNSAVDSKECRAKPACG